jgi:hypothetical protein
MNACPCCSSTLLRHIRHNQIDWFCQHCWEFMPNFSHPIQSSHALVEFHNEVDLVVTTPGWNREMDRHPHVVNLSDSLRFKNSKPQTEKSRLLVSTNPLK